MVCGTEVGPGSGKVTFSGRLVDWGLIQFVSAADSACAIGVGNGFDACRGDKRIGRTTG